MDNPCLTEYFPWWCSVAQAGRRREEEGMSGRFRVGAALTGIVVLTAAGLIAANGAQADPQTGAVGDAELPVADQQLLQVQSQARGTSAAWSSAGAPPTW